MGVAIAARRWLVASVFAVGTLASADAGWAKAKAEEEKPDPACAGYAETLASLPKRGADATDTASVKLARAVVAQWKKSDDPKLLDMARAACEEEQVVGKAYRLPAYLCVAEVSALLARQGETAAKHHEDAFCSYEIAADLALRGAPNDKATLATIQEGRAVALAALKSKDWQARSVEAYEAAIKAEPTPARHLALGRLYLAQGKGDLAEMEIREGAKGGGNPAETALVLVSLAELKQEQKASAEQVLSILSLAKEAAPKSVSVNGAIGLVLLDMGKKADARDAFRAATANDATNDAVEGASARNYRAESYYNLAVLAAADAKTAKDWALVNADAKSAFQAGGNGPRYRRLICLGAVAQGGDALRDAESWCDAQDTPEAQLALSMYYIRQAQHVPAFEVRSVPSAREQQYRDLVRKAEDAIAAGAKAADAGKGGGGKEWPGGQAPNFAELFPYGTDLARWVDSLCRDTTLKAKLAQTPSAMSFFDHYHAQGCRP